MNEPIAGENYPMAPDAEEAVLGAVLIDQGEILPDLAWLRPEDFYFDRNRWVWEGMLGLLEKKMPIDYITINQALEASGHLNELGGPARIMQLINRTPTSLNAKAYAGIVQEMATRRRVLYETSALTMAAYDLKADIRQAVSRAQDNLSISTVHGTGAQPISLYLDQLKTQIEELQAEPITSGVWGIPTGLANWDNITGGLQFDEVVKLCGDPGIGKSLLAMQLLITAAEHGYPGVLYEMEMSIMQVLRRAVSAMTHILNPGERERALWMSTRQMRTGLFDDRQFTSFLMALEHMRGLPIYISERTDWTTPELRADLRGLIRRHDLAMVVLDYEALLKDQAENANEHSKMVSGRVHDMTKEFHLATISIGDVTKENIQGKVQGQGGMAGTAREIHNADQVIFLKKDKNPDVINVVWEKFRDGDSSEKGFQLLKLNGFPVYGVVTPKQPEGKVLPF